MKTSNSNRNTMTNTQEKKYDKRAFWAKFDTRNPQHKAIQSLLFKAGIVKDWNGRVVPDMAYVDNFLKNEPKAPVKKPLKEQSTTELSKTIYALEQIIDFKLKNQ